MRHTNNHAGFDVSVKEVCNSLTPTGFDVCVKEVCNSLTPTGFDVCLKEVCKKNCNTNSY